MLTKQGKGNSIHFVEALITCNMGFRDRGENYHYNDVSL